MQTEQQQPQSLQQVQAAYQKARELMLAGDLDEAEGLCRRTLPRFEQDPNIRCLLGEILIKQRRPQEARGWFSKTLKLLPDFPRALEGLGLVLLAELFAGSAMAGSPNR